MSTIAGQTSGPNGLKFFEGNHGCPRGGKSKKKLNILFFKISFFIPRAPRGTPASIKHIYYYYLISKPDLSPDQQLCPQRFPERKIKFINKNIFKCLFINFNISL